MRILPAAVRALIAATFLVCIASAQPVKTYNKAKQKLAEGHQIVGVTVFSPDPNIYCAAANAGLRLHLDRNAAQPAHI